MTAKWNGGFLFLGQEFSGSGGWGWLRSHRPRRLGLKLAPLVLGSLAALVPLSIAAAAERVTLRYGIFSRSIPVASLEAFAAEGTVDANLAGFFRGLDQPTLDQLQAALAVAKPIDPLVFSQKLQTPMGERMLLAAGQTVQTGAGLNGHTALRAALIKAAATPEGLSLINTLRYFPTEGVVLNLDRALAVKRHLGESIRQTNDLIALVEQQSAAAAAASPVDYEALPDLRVRGPYPVQFIPLDLYDTSRNRAVPADLFLPQRPDAAAGSIPIIVFSHGLGHSRIYFRDVAEYLASHGFAVAMPEHLGSNETQRQAMESWLSREFFRRREFIDRPQDISFLLDELTRLNSTEFNQQLKVDTVGAIGHSFGGYTVLAAAGATVDFDWLQQQCAPEAEFVSNISRLLQCRALELEANPQDVALLTQGGLRDERIKLVMAFNTVSRLFGETGTRRIQVPTLIAAGGYDYVTPLIPEQADTFRWLTTPEKYFLLVDQKAHGDESTRTLFQFVYALEDQEDIELAQQWLRSNYTALLVAFAKVYLADQEEYRPYLTAAYIEHIGVEPFLMHLVRSLPEP